MNFFTNTIPDIIFIIDFDKANILKCVSSYLYYLHFGEFPLIDSHARHRFVWLGLGLIGGGGLIFIFIILLGGGSGV